MGTRNDWERRILKLVVFPHLVLSADFLSYHFELDHPRTRLAPPSPRTRQPPLEMAMR